jgi:hypothetical protein
MQHTTEIWLKPELTLLFEALADKVQVEMASDAMTLLEAAPESEESVALTDKGHVQLRANKSDGVVTLQIDANRHRIKTARAVCDAWTDVYRPAATARTPDLAKVAFGHQLSAILKAR